MQLYLHSGVPSYNTATADYVLGFGETMSGALADQILNRERKGLFSPSCFYTRQNLLQGDAVGQRRQWVTLLTTSLRCDDVIGAEKKV